MLGVGTKRMALIVWALSANPLFPTELTDLIALTLPEAIERALQRNEEVRMAQEDVGKSKAAYGQVRAGGLPRVDLSLGYSRSWLLPTVVFDTPTGRQRFNIGTDNSLTGNLVLSQALYSGGRIRASRSSARSLTRYSVAAERGIRQQIRAMVEEGFYSVMRAIELDKVSASALIRARSNLRQVTALRRAGRALEYDLVRARVQVNVLQSDSIEVRNGLDMSRADFKRLVGIDPDRKLALVGGFDHQAAVPTDSLGRLVSLALQQRPEMQQLGALVQARRRDVDVERAGLKPEIFLVANGQMQLQTDNLDVAGEEWRRSLSTGLSLRFPIFDGLLTRSKIEEANIELRKSELEKQRVAKIIGLEVKRAWLDLRASESRLASQQGVLGLAETGLSMAQSRYFNGLGTQLELLDAQLVIRQAEADLADVAHDRAVALVRLEQATGMLSGQ